MLLKRNGYKILCMWCLICRTKKNVSFISFERISDIRTPMIFAWADKNSSINVPNQTFLCGGTNVWGNDCLYAILTFETIQQKVRITNNFVDKIIQCFSCCGDVARHMFTYKPDIVILLILLNSIFRSVA